MLFYFWCLVKNFSSNELKFRTTNTIQPIFGYQFRNIWEKSFDNIAAIIVNVESDFFKIALQIKFEDKISSE